MKNKRGISLIILVITIIVIVVLATAVIVSLANNNPVENANVAKYKSDISNIKDLVNLASTDILLEKVEDSADAYKGIIPEEYEMKLHIEKGVLYYKGEYGQEEEWAKEIGVIRKEFLPDDWIDISKSTPENGIGLLIGKPADTSTTISFKVTTTSTYSVDWGDGSSKSYGSEVEASHTYSTNNDKSSTDGYLFQVKIAPDTGEITKFEHTQYPNSTLLWCQIGCDTLTDCKFMLDNAVNLKKFGIANKTSLSQVTDMKFMFTECGSLTNIPYFDTNKVTDMYGMFFGCRSLETIPKLDTSQVKSMDSMFAYCRSLESIPELDTSKVEIMEYTFIGCSSLKTIAKLDTSSVTSMRWMFDECSSLESISIANTNLTSEQINNVFAELPDSKNKAVIDITGNPGESGCDKTMLKFYGWTAIP